MNPLLSRTDSSSAPIHCAASVAFNSPVSVRVQGHYDLDRLQLFASKAMQMVRSIERRTDGRLEHSDVARINQCGHVAPLTIHPWLYELLAESLRFCNETQGAFDVTHSPVRNTSGLLPRHFAASGLREAGKFEDVQLLPGCQVYLKSPLFVDFGPVASAFAVDRAITFLSTLGLQSAAVSVGDDCRTLGSCPFRPDSEPHLSPVMLRPGLASDIGFAARLRSGHQRAVPPVNPISGKLMKSNLRLHVFSRTCLEARALIRAVLLNQQELWTRLLIARDSLAIFLTRRHEQILFPV
jgi:FAD:protein FMN transferase